MNRENKIISAVAVSTLLISSGIVVMANNDNDTKSTNSTNKIVNAIKSKDGKNVEISIDNMSTTSGIYLEIIIEGDTNIEDDYFSPFKNTNSVKYTFEKSKLEGNKIKITLAITSTGDLLSVIGDKGTVKIGTIKTSGGSYKISEVKMDIAGGVGIASESVSLSESQINTEKNDNTPNGEGGNTGGGSGNDNTGGDNSGNNDNTGGSSSGGSGGGSSKPEEEKPLENNVQLFSMSGKDRYETSTKISKTGWTSGAKNVVIVNGNEENMVDGLSATPFATIKDAPVLLSNGKTLPASTISELKRLNPTNIYVIGGTASMPESVVSSIKSNTKATVTRIGGSTRYETSLAIAKQIDKIADVSKVYISSGTGEVDALSIASVAGREKAPILLTNVNSIDNKTYDFIRSESIKDAYFIGGDKKISNSVINQVDKVVSADVSKNRVAGRNRKDTNAAIIKKFYTGSKLNGVVVSKDDVIIDALTVGSFAAKNDMPVVIGKDSLSTAQKNVLSSKNTEKVYQAGGGVKTSVINNLKELLGTKK